MVIFPHYKYILYFSSDSIIALAAKISIFDFSSIAINAGVFSSDKSQLHTSHNVPLPLCKFPRINFSDNGKLRKIYKSIIKTSLYRRIQWQ
jgi:hypothetical protein